MIGDFFYSIALGMVWIYFRLRYRLTVHNKFNRPHQKNGFIIACNHQSYVDPPLIGAVIMRRLAFMAKQELFDGNKAFALVIRLCGAFPVVRGAGDGSAINAAVAQLQKGRNLVIFPEGTRSKDGKIGRAKSGVAMIAAMANAPVLPMCIMYGVNGKRRVDVAVGEMIRAEELQIDTGNRQEIKHVAALIIDRIKDLQSEILTEEEL
ncbi:MAG: 1-acyl-sn-glycerol-3-phosphate acyltransferase [Oscillospiraceae bacterium]|nr:1-acyl-sn-glycerol-3-phosphate acyltransferase [Oscillospiraceae bacterium]